MSEKIRAYAVSGPKQQFKVFEYDPGELRIFRSDLETKPALME